MKMPKMNKKTDEEKAHIKADKEERRFVKKKGPKFEKMGIDELVPVIRKHGDYDAYIMEDGSFLSIYGNNEKNLRGTSETEVSFDNARWDKLYKTYSDDLKVVTSNFPTDTRTQVAYYDHLLEKADSSARTNEVLKRLLEEKREELVWIAENRHEESASLFVYSENLNDYREKDRRVRSTLSGLIYDYDETMRNRILYMLYNKTEAL